MGPRIELVYIKHLKEDLPIYLVSVSSHSVVIVTVCAFYSVWRIVHLSIELILIASCKAIFYNMKSWR